MVLFLISFSIQENLFFISEPSCHTGIGPWFHAIMVSKSNEGKIFELLKNIYGVNRRQIAK